jgi:hypothetical protein
MRIAVQAFRQLMQHTSVFASQATSGIWERCGFAKKEIFFLGMADLIANQYSGDCKLWIPDVSLEKPQLAHADLVREITSSVAREVRRQEMLA